MQKVPTLAQSAGSVQNADLPPLTGTDLDVESGLPRHRESGGDSGRRRELTPTVASRSRRTLGGPMSFHRAAPDAWDGNRPIGIVTSPVVPPKVPFPISAAVARDTTRNIQGYWKACGDAGLIPRPIWELVAAQPNGMELLERFRSVIKMYARTGKGKWASVKEDTICPPPGELQDEHIMLVLETMDASAVVNYTNLVDVVKRIDDKFQGVGVVAVLGDWGLVQARLDAAVPGLKLDGLERRQQSSIVTAAINRIPSEPIQQLLSTSVGQFPDHNSPILLYESCIMNLAETINLLLKEGAAKVTDQSNHRRGHARGRANSSGGAQSQEKTQAASVLAVQGTPNTTTQRGAAAEAKPAIEAKPAAGGNGKQSKHKDKPRRVATSTTECFTCHKLGHYSWECPENKAKGASP